MATPKTTTENAPKKNRRQFVGVVTSNKMQNTVTVEVSRFVQHPRYKKFINRMKKFHAHTTDKIEEGTKVTIEECAPLSKTKHFIVVSTAPVAIVTETE